MRRRFQSTRPMRGATKVDERLKKACGISIHAPHAGRDLCRGGTSYITEEFQSTRPMRGATHRPRLVRVRQLISIHAPHAGRDLICWPCTRCPGNFNPRAPCGARRRTARPVSAMWIFQSTRPMRGATSSPASVWLPHPISIHAPHAGRDPPHNHLLHILAYFNPRAPCGARPVPCHPALPWPQHFNPRAPCGARLISILEKTKMQDISIHAPHAGRDRRLHHTAMRRGNFNPRAPCGARPLSVMPFTVCVRISIHAPHAGRDSFALLQLLGHLISIHAPHAGRDSKSIQNYFTHFCDKRQFLDNFTQNAAFQSVLPLADRQKLLYLRCEPLRKFLRAFASHYKIIGSSGR